MSSSQQERCGLLMLRATSSFRNRRVEARPSFLTAASRQFGLPMPMALLKRPILLHILDGQPAPYSSRLPTRLSMALDNIRPTIGTTRARTRSSSSITPRCRSHSWCRTKIMACSLTLIQCAVSAILPTTRSSVLSSSSTTRRARRAH